LAADIPIALSNVRFSNRPFGVKHFQTIRRCGVDVTHGLVLLFGIGTRALPSWDSKTRWNNADRRLMTPASLFAKLAEHYAARAEKPFSHIVVDEAQDLGVAELRFLAAITLDRPDAIFFAGDLGQRIFQPPFSWKGLGVDAKVAPYAVFSRLLT
jgi:UvrD/REP helicase N-terminal domain